MDWHVFHHSANRMILWLCSACFGFVIAGYRQCSLLDSVEGDLILHEYMLHIEIGIVMGKNILSFRHALEKNSILKACIMR